MMLTFYIAESGEITGCAEVFGEPCAAPGESWIEGEYSPDEYRVENNLPVKIPKRPDEFSQWSQSLQKWVDVRSVEEIQEENISQIKKRRDKAIQSGMIFNGIHLATDETTQARITGAALAAIIDPSYQVQWKMPDGSFVTLVAAQVIAFAQAIRAHVQACFDREAEIKALIEAGQPYDLEAGWP